MIRELFESKYLDDYSRANTPNDKFTTFTSIGNNIFGAGSQNVTNAGSSMLIDTPNTYPNIKSMFEEYFALSSLPVIYSRLSYEFNKKYDGKIFHGSDLGKIVASKTSVEDLLALESISIVDSPLYNDLRTVFLRYKKDLEYRKELNRIIFEDINTLSIAKNLSVGFTFIIYAMVTLKNNHYLKKSSNIGYKEVKSKYSDEAKFFSKIGQVLNSSDDLVDITDCCVGRYRFVDYHLSRENDIKLLPQILTYYIVDGSNLIEDMLSIKRSLH